MKRRSAIKDDLFAAEHRREKIDRLGDPLIKIEAHIDFVALAAEVDWIAPRPNNAQGGRRAFPTETMVRIVVLKRSSARARAAIRFPNASAGATTESPRPVRGSSTCSRRWSKWAVN